MANRINTFLIKRSNTPGKIPTAGSLLLGEIALNTADAKLYTSGTTAGSILPIGWDRVSKTGDTMTGRLYAPSISATTISATTIIANNISGTTNYVAKFTGANSLGNSLIYDNGTSVGINTSTPNATYKLDVSGATRLNGLQTLQGTTASDTSPLGVELITTGSSDASWTGTSFASGYTHITGSTTQLTSTLAAVVGTTYVITTTISNYVSGSISLTFGGYTYYTGQIITRAFAGYAVNTNSLAITPTTDFNATIVISVKTVGIASPITTFTNSTGSIVNEIRADGNNLSIGVNSGTKPTIVASNSSWNTHIGHYAGQIDNGRYNTFIGYNSGKANSNGSQMTAIGYGTLTNVVNGFGSVAIGYLSQNSTTGSSGNISVGDYSLQTSTGSNNTVIGSYAGAYIADKVTAANNLINSIMFGYKSSPLADNQINQVVIGNQATGLGSNTTVLGNSSTTTAAIYGNLLLGKTGDTGQKLQVSGNTLINGNLTANTISANSINRVNYIVFNTGTTSATTVPGTVYFDNTEKALSYNTSINQGVTVNLGQQQYLRVFNNSGSLISKGKALEVFSAYSGLPSVTLAVNKHTGFNIVGVSAEDIPNNSEGIIITNGIISNIPITGVSVGSLVYASDSVPGQLDNATKYLDFPLTARTNSVGYVIQTGTTTGKIFVDIKNENNVLSFTDLERDVLEGNIASTGAFGFSGLTLGTGNTFNVGAAQGWIIDNLSNSLQPDAKYVYYSGQTGLTTPYLLTDTETYILLNSGNTLTLVNSFPTPQQRRQNIYLGKLGHANKTSLINAFNEADFDISPISQLRDMFTPIKLINSGVIPTPNGANLNFNTSAGTIWGMGIGFVTNQLNPNSLSVSGGSPTTFQYRTQTGGTATNTTTIVPGNYDLNGVITPIGAPAKQATNQRIYLLQNGNFRIQYGQTIYADLTAAVAGAQTESFVTFPNFKDNAILIGFLSLRSDTTNLSDPLYAKFLFVSKFGEIMGGTGGLSTTTLQQAYNNSSVPIITTNSTLGGLSIINGSGSADTVSNLFIGENTSGNITSFIRADGYISGATFQTNGAYINNNGLTATIISATTIQTNGSFINNNGITATTISATTYQNLPIDIRTTGVTYTNNTFTFTNNTGGTYNTLFNTLTGLTINGNLNVTGNTIIQNLTATTISGLTFSSKNTYGTVLVNSSNNQGMISISGSNTVGGTGYTDFIKVTNTAAGATNINKTIRVNNTGGIEFLDSTYNNIRLSISDSGAIGAGPATSTSSDATSNYLFFNNNGSQIYDDGNFHIHSRSAGQAMWINTNGGQLNLLVQSPTATGSIGSGIAIATGTLNGYVSINTGKTITSSSSYGYLTTGGAGTYGGGSQTLTISLYANSRIWGQEIDAFSDERMKDIQGEIKLEDGLKLVNSLKPIKYTWKEGDDKGVKAGYSAQQVIKSGFDHLVGMIPKEGLEETIDEDGFMSPKDTQFSMNYDQVTPYHGVVIKHLLEEITLLKKEIELLKNK